MATDGSAAAPLPLPPAAPGDVPAPRPLTRREMDIVAYLHLHRERIVSKAELLTAVWHYKDSRVETRTVEIHILKLRKKMAALTDGRGVIQTVRGEGYRLEPVP